MRLPMCHRHRAAQALFDIALGCAGTNLWLGGNDDTHVNLRHLSICAIRILGSLMTRSGGANNSLKRGNSRLSANMTREETVQIPAPARTDLCLN
uniref:Uncharacterized protein n=1 Tax=Ralstonia syzygii R24 TaxID=907261 RepID=G3A8Y6_9RALS|nr:hypothetical protein RALSY_mp10240 [Ralstonia syzygii R24]